MKLLDRLKKLPKLFKICFISAVAAVIVCLVGLHIYGYFSSRTFNGIDVSHYQGDISWRSLKESGKVNFVFIKATEGKAYKDTDFKKNWKGSTGMGIPTGAYHFYSPSSTGKAQAKNFISTVPKVKGALPPTIDIESNAVSQKGFKSQVADYVDLITKHYGQKPVFYVSYRVYDMLYDKYHDCPFWIIDYGKKEPSVTGWDFWQYSEKGKVASIVGNVDLDEYRGSMYGFRKLLSK